MLTIKQSKPYPIRVITKKKTNLVSFFENGDGGGLIFYFPNSLWLKVYLLLKNFFFKSLKYFIYLFIHFESFIIADTPSFQIYTTAHFRKEYRRDQLFHLWSRDPCPSVFFSIRSIILKHYNFRFSMTFL